MDCIYRWSRFEMNLCISINRTDYTCAMHSSYNFLGIYRNLTVGWIELENPPAMPKSFHLPRGRLLWCYVSASVFVICIGKLLFSLSGKKKTESRLPRLTHNARLRLSQAGQPVASIFKRNDKWNTIGRN